MFSAESLNFLTPRIVGGSIVSSIEDIPYQVSIQLGSKHYCGGVIISNNYVLTAAACVTAGTTYAYTIRAGTLCHNYGGSIHQVSKIIVHPNYYTNNYNIPVNDIALIQVTIPFTLDGTKDAIPIADLPARVGSVAKISGWGWMNSSFPIQLRKANVQIINKSSCNATYQGRLPAGQICTYTGGRDSCQADGGGPLVTGIHLTGIISWGKGCAVQGYPGVYTDVYAYRQWINRYVPI